LGLAVLVISIIFLSPALFKANTHKPGGGLVIPKNAKKLEFLEGCWIADAGLVETKNRNPINYKYCFDKLGNANIYIYLFDKNQKLVDICVGKGKATLWENGVRIEDSGPYCPEVKISFVKVILNCGVEEQEQESSCKVDVSNGNKFKADFSYLGIE
jgi:hypothetical protein